MTKDAFTYAMQHVQLPKGKMLRLYGDAGLAGDIYTPFHDRFMASQGRGQVAFPEPQEIKERYETVILDCPKQQEETEGLLALAFSRSLQCVMAVAGNDTGGNRLAKLFARYGVEAHTLSKHHCKIVTTFGAAKADQTIIARDLALLEPHPLMMEEREWWSLPGLFGWNKIDPGSKLLAEHLPADLNGKAADFGCGFGYLSAQLIERAASIISVDAYDYDMRAVQVAKRNVPEKLNGIWQDMRSFEPEPVYDVVVMNPPFHVGKEEDIGLGENFIRKAWKALRSNGQLFMVANRNLPYEQIVRELKTIYSGQGYKVMTGCKP